MTLLLREVVRFLAGAIAWVGVELAIAAAAAAPGVLFLRTDRLRSLGAGFAGAVILAALAVRFGAPFAWSPVLGGRPLPVAWSVAGAVLGVVLEAAARRQAPAHP